MVEKVRGGEYSPTRLKVRGGEYSPTRIFAHHAVENIRPIFFHTNALSFFFLDLCS
jgi:hypothetical protein